MVGATEEGARWALHDHDPLERWHAGRTVVIGDAAHAMVPHQGQGANQTIEDAATLATASPGRVPPTPARRSPGSWPSGASGPHASRPPRDAPPTCCTSPDPAELPERDARFADPYRDLAWIHAHDVRAAVPAH